MFRRLALLVLGVVSGWLIPPPTPVSAPVKLLVGAPVSADRWDTPPPTSLTQPEASEAVMLCPLWRDLAATVGWSPDTMQELGYVMWRESRCDPSVHFAGDPNGGSHGLMQVNGFWCKPNRYTTVGWLQSLGVLDGCNELYDPSTNLTAALEIFQYSERENGNGWEPWSLASGFCDHSHTRCVHGD